ncbi:MAG: Stp1/IreP family PP2C-type Ser/Thr phosphatase [Bacteroidales bacterium]|nr:Stp1/IreP family PP2C-type Ser/Thr phosphatase [Bacteroidales bacterium]
MTDQYNYCHVVGQSDVGRKRAANEDSMGNAVTQNGLVSVVCDGMGGHVGGATASRIAVKTILDNLDSTYYDDPRIAIGESIDIANRAILNEAEAHPELSGMGSTCVLLIVRDGKVYIGHVGDSRIYLIRSKKIIQLTKDHSYVQMLVDRGEITQEQAEHHPRKNEITNALGIPNMTPATVADDAIIPEAGDCFLLCSDGLSGMVPNDAINKVVSQQSELNAQERVDRLVMLANENGGVDNITAQIVEFPVTPNIVKPGKKIPLWMRILIPALLVIVLCLGAYWLIKSKKSDEDQDGIQEEIENVVSTIVMDVTIGERIPFSKNGELITLLFSDNLVVFKYNDKQVHTEKETLDLQSISVNSPAVDILFKAPSLVLKFTDKYPGDKVLLKIDTKDKSKTYQYTITVFNSSDKPGIRPSPNGKKAKKDDRSDQRAKPVPNIQSVNVQINYDVGSFDKPILFNYFAKPCFRINGMDIPISDTLLDEVITSDVVYDKDNWNLKFVPDRRQIQLVFKGSASIQEYSFQIPCYKKDSTTDIIVLMVKLTPKSPLEDKGSDTSTDAPRFETV